jgi:hypothetical protein
MYLDISRNNFGVSYLWPALIRSELEGIRRVPHTSGFSWHRIATKTPSLSSGYTVAGTEDIRDIFGFTKTVDLAE